MFLTRARAFSQIHTHGNFKNEMTNPKKAGKKRRMNMERSTSDLTIASVYRPSWSLLPKAAYKLPN